MLSNAQEIEIYYKIRAIYIAFTHCKTLAEVSAETKITPDMVRKYLKSEHAKTFLGTARLEFIKKKTEEMKKEARRLALLKTALTYERIRNPESGLILGVRKK